MEAKLFELKECPICSAYPPRVMQRYGGWVVRCPECSAQTANMKLKIDAKVLWNCGEVESWRY